jgi:hypothetical protein
MGMAVKKKGAGKKGAGKSKKAAAPFDAAASLLKMERLHQEMKAKSAKVINKDDNDVVDEDMVVSEFMIAARSARSSTATVDLRAVADWIPVAQLCIARPIREVEQSEGSADKVVQAAVSYYCREVSQAAAFGAPKFRDVPRHEMQYSVESLDSFHRHVYDHMNGKNADLEGSMTKAEARKVLDLEEGSEEKSDIKQAYRKLSFKLHPDRFMGVERTAEEETVSNDAFLRVKTAYETMTSGVSNENGSWYRSLGGKERADFVALELLSINDAKVVLDSVKQDTAVCSLDSDMVQPFVARNMNA